MKETILLALLICIGFALWGDPYLDAQPAPEDDGLWLARAMVAEADWRADTDHRAIGYVLLAKYRIVQRRYPRVTVAAIARAYCSGLEHDDRRSKRLRWVYRLDRAGQQPLGWPIGSPWLRYSGLWRKVLRTADKCLSGEVADPCRGRAEHWGGPMDTPSDRLERVDCGRTVNTFYRVRRVGR